MTERPTIPLWAPAPENVRGWGRFVRIVCFYPLAPLELLAGAAATFRGQYVLDPVHVAVRTAAWSALARYGFDINVLAWSFLLLGLLQIVACLYEWQRIRLVVAALLGGLMVSLVLSYLVVEQGGWGPLVHVPMMVAQIWITLRSVPLFAPRGRGDAGA